MKKTVIKILATGLGLGYLPLAPGTWGTLLGIPLAYALHYRGTLPYLAITIIFTIFAIFIAEMAEPIFGKHDCQQIVIDEVAGFLVTMAMLPATWQSFALGFLLFRILDATKPGPIRYLDRRIKGGLGVVLDDVAAGIFANILLQIVYTYTSVLGARLP